MQQTEKITAKPNYYLPLLLLFILADIICDNYIFGSFSNDSSTQQLCFFIGLSFLQIVASPIQAGFSDFYCRKKSLVVSLSFSLFALILVFIYNKKILFYFPVLILLTFIKGAFGNTIPLAWAGIADMQERNFRFSFGLSTSSYAVGYLVLIFVNKFLTVLESNFMIILLFIILIYFCIKHFRDIRDEKDANYHANENLEKLSKFLPFALLKNETKQIIEDLKREHIRKALTAFLLWETSLYSVLLLYVDFQVKQFSMIAVSMMLGYLLGVFILKFCGRMKDSTLIKLGYNFSSLSLIPFFILFPFVERLDYSLLTICYFFHTMGNAFLCPTLFSMLSKEKKPHEQGKIYGLIESVDTIAFLLASIAVILYNYLHLNLIFIIGFSFITVVISWFPYEKFEKTRFNRV